jgi:hypothetical protein
MSAVKKNNHSNREKNSFEIRDTKQKYSAENLWLDSNASPYLNKRRIIFEVL